MLMPVTRRRRSRPPSDLIDTGPLVTNAQKNFIEALLGERDLYAKTWKEQRGIAESTDGRELARKFREGNISKAEVSDLITWLKGMPKNPDGANVSARNADLPDVPEGRYAVKHNNGELRFYRISRPAKGKWQGWTFVDMQISDYFEPLKDASKSRRVLNFIVEHGIPECARLYGRHIGCCSRCGRVLTNRISRLLDIGPICGGHFYDEGIWRSLRDNARAALVAAGLDPDVDVEDTDDLDAIRERIGL
jgi:hypothetical protein